MADDQHDYGELLVLQYHPAAGLGDLESMLEGRAGRRPFRVVDLAAGDEVPPLTDPIRGILVLDGPPSLAGPDQRPWFDRVEELELVLAAIYGEVPVFGIGLGAQLLTTALDGEVTRLDAPVVGFAPLTRTGPAHDDEIFAGWPDGSTALVLHRDAISRPPPGAEAMLEGPDGPVAWRMGDGESYGVQFHPELGPATLEGWLGEPELEAFFEHPDLDREELLEDAQQREAFARGWGVSLVGRWVDGVVGAGDPRPTG